MTIIVPAPGWLWLPVILVLGWATLSLDHETRMYGKARDSMEVLIQKGTTVYLAPPVDTIRRRVPR